MQKKRLHSQNIQAQVKINKERLWELLCRQIIKILVNIQDEPRETAREKMIHRKEMLLNRYLQNRIDNFENTDEWIGLYAI